MWMTEWMSQPQGLGEGMLAGQLLNTQSCTSAQWIVNSFVRVSWRGIRGSNCMSISISWKNYVLPFMSTPSVSYMQNAEDQQAAVI